MAARISARLTAHAGRRFGLTVGGAFLVIAAALWWRGHPVGTNIAGGLGIVLVLAGLAIPTHLGPVERAWMALAHAISKITTPIVMGVMYLVVITPTGILRRIFGGNPLQHARAEQGYWKFRAPGARKSGSLRRQF